jgi:hypothetical protein
MLLTRFWAICRNNNFWGQLYKTNVFSTPYLIYFSSDSQKQRILSQKQQNCDVQIPNTWLAWRRGP